MEMMYHGQKVTVFEQRQLSSTILVDGDAINVSNAALKPVKAPKLSCTRLALVAEPVLFEALVQHCLKGRIEISGQPSRIPAEATRLSSVSSLTELDAVDYIKPTTEQSHSFKYDIIVSADIPAELQKFIGVYFKKGLRSSANEYQINCQSLADFLMKERDMLPVKW